MAKRRRFTAGYEARVALEARWQDKTVLKDGVEDWEAACGGDRAANGAHAAYLLDTLEQSE